ncbi:MAG: discoidin domain-containing protein [Bryobacterales bacterium]|nr:discoidin domain-containing protein [Bryobacterales bacterium]
MNKTARTGFLAMAAAMVVTSLDAAPINVALATNGGTAQQSSTFRPEFPASHAIDGTINGTGNNISHTSSELNAWWQVTFNASYFITEVTIFNRTDCCPERINAFSVFLYDAGNNVVWSQTGNSIILPATTATFTGINTVGNRLRVQLDGTNFLHLEEVVAMGDTAPANDIPEPSTCALAGAGLLVVWWRRKPAIECQADSSRGSRK